MGNTGNYCKLSKLAFGLASGLLWAISVLLMGLLGWSFGWFQPFVHMLGTMYSGYSASLMGSIWGAFLAFIDAFIGGFLLALFYNYSLCCCKKHCNKQEQ